MNENNLTQTTNQNDTLQNIVIPDIHQKIFDAVTDAENTSKEKYTRKTGCYGQEL